MTSSLIDITFADHEDEAVHDKLKGLRNRIDAIAEVHEQLCENDGSGYIQLDYYLEKLLWKNITALTPSPDKVKMSIRIDDIHLEAGKVIPLGMIISEFITNSLKHSGNHEVRTIKLSAVKKDGTLSVRYSDGRNIPLCLDGRKTTGLRLIDGLSGQLGSKIYYKNRHILLEIPV